MHAFQVCMEATPLVISGAVTCQKHRDTGRLVDERMHHVDLKCLINCLLATGGSSTFKQLKLRSSRAKLIPYVF